MTTMTETEDFVKLFEESYNYKFSVADTVKGIVVKQDKNGWLVDIGAKSEAFLSEREVGANDDVKIGEVREFYIVREETDKEDSCILLSLKRLSCAKSWQVLQDAKLANETVRAKVVSSVKGGVIVECEEIKGFIPSSQLRTASPFNGLIGQTIDVKILEADPKKNKLILSQRQAIAEQREKVVDDIILNLKEDTVVSGEVVRITDFGAFVDINGIDGLLPISEISWQRIKHPSDVIELGQKLELKILKIDPELKRISLSLKRMGENPWEEIEKNCGEGQIITGTVNKVTAFGAFINIFPGVEALLPAAEMLPDDANPFSIYNVGDEVKVLIKKFSPQEHRIALSVRDIPENER